MSSNSESACVSAEVELCNSNINSTRVGVVKKSMDFCGDILTVEYGKLAMQSTAALTISLGNTVVFVTVVVSEDEVDLGYLPLAVDFISKFYSLGKFPSGFLKREGKLSDREILVSRVIDRTIRPLFPKSFSHDVQITAMLLGYDGGYPAEVVAQIGVMLALKISRVPLEDTVFLSKVNIQDAQSEFLVNKGGISGEESCLTIATGKDKIYMAEACSLELSKSNVIAAVECAIKSNEQLFLFADEFCSECVPMHEIKFIDRAAKVAAVVSEFREKYANSNPIDNCFCLKNKKHRTLAFKKVANQIANDFAEAGIEKTIFQEALYDFEREYITQKVFENGKRLDGRAFDEVREINIDTAFLPAPVYGSVVFTRGYTQALAVVTIGDYGDEQIVDDHEGSRRESFLMHYNFLRFSVGESGPLRPPGRREVGHGTLARNGLLAVMPSKTSFPCTVRVVSEILSSDGSSSMATVCGASLALMDAGVPISKPVAGIAMGLLIDSETRQKVVVSDILGDEDHFGYMDFKLVSTADGMTALQLDLASDSGGIDLNLFSEIFDQASSGIVHILGIMNAAVPTIRAVPRSAIPLTESFFVDSSKIRYIIGKGGKNIKDICDKTNTRVSIKQDGCVVISGAQQENIDNARNIIVDMLEEVKVGEIYSGVVSKQVAQGLLVELSSGKKGLIPNESLKGAMQIGVGSVVKCRCTEIDSKGRYTFALIIDEASADACTVDVFDTSELESTDQIDESVGICAAVSEDNHSDDGIVHAVDCVNNKSRGAVCASSRKLVGTDSKKSDKKRHPSRRSHGNSKSADNIKSDEIISSHSENNDDEAGEAGNSSDSINSQTENRFF